MNLKSTVKCQSIDFMAAVLLASMCLLLTVYRVDSNENIKIIFISLFLCSISLLAIKLFLENIKIVNPFNKIGVILFIQVIFLYLFSTVSRVVLGSSVVGGEVSLVSWFIVCFASVICVILYGSMYKLIDFRRMLVYSISLFYIVNILLYFSSFDVGPGLNSLLSIKASHDSEFSLIQLPLVSSTNGTNALLVILYGLVKPNLWVYLLRAAIVFYLVLTLSITPIACLILFHFLNLLQSIKLNSVYIFGAICIVLFLPPFIVLSTSINEYLMPSVWGALSGRELIWGALDAGSLVNISSFFGYGLFGHYSAGVYDQFSYMFSPMAGLQGMHNSWIQLVYDIGYVGAGIYLIRYLSLIHSSEASESRVLLSLLPLTMLENVFSPYYPETFLMISVYIFVGISSRCLFRNTSSDNYS
jgi:hypothetical protein